MQNSNYKHYLSAIGLFLLLTIIGLWSWNTLAELFDLPYAHYKHALAAFVLLVILKWGLSANRYSFNHAFGVNHEHTNH